jgi:hypothetical protein
MITDEVFRKELDDSLKRQGLKKKERNHEIEQAILNVDTYSRDRRLELERQLIPYKERVPLESHEQKRFVAWWRSTYPQWPIINVKNDNSKNKDIEMGIHPGVSDLYIRHFNIWLEMKRVKQWKHSEQQKDFQAYVESEGDVYILGIGFEDAKKKIIERLNLK